MGKLPTIKEPEVDAEEAKLREEAKELIDAAPPQLLEQALELLRQE